MFSPDCLVSGQMLEIADWVPDDILPLLRLRLRAVTRSGVRSPVTLASHWSGVVIPALSWAVYSQKPLGLGIQDSNFCQTSLNASNHLRLASVANLSPPPYYLLLHTFYMSMTSSWLGLEILARYHYLQIDL